MKLGEENLHSLIWNELKVLGVCLPKYKKKSTVCKKEDSLCFESCPDQVFGVSLATQEWIAVDCHGTPVPRFLAIATEYLLQHKQLEGLFRKGGSVVRQRELKKRIEKGGSLDSALPHDVSSLLKEWFRQLPESIIPNNLHNIFVRCYQLEGEHQITACLLACLLLPPDHLYTLQHTVNFFSDVAKCSSQNRMNSRNLALIMAPNLFPSSHPQTEKTNKLLQYQTGLVNLLIDNCSQVGQFPAEVAEKLGYPSIVTRADGGCDKTPDGIEKLNDVFEGQPKAKKKRCSGTMQDLVNGIRKFVTHGRTPAQTFPVTPEESPIPLVLEQNDLHHPVTRSASKQKFHTSQSANCNRTVQEASLPFTSPKINEITPGLSSCTMVSLSDTDSPIASKYMQTPPIIETRRKSLRILKNKQKMKNRKSSIYSRINKLPNTEFDILKQSSEEPQQPKIPKLNPSTEDSVSPESDKNVIKQQTFLDTVHSISAASAEHSTEEKYETNSTNKIKQQDESDHSVNVRLSRTKRSITKDGSIKSTSAVSLKDVSNVLESKIKISEMHKQNIIRQDSSVRKIGSTRNKTKPESEMQISQVSNKPVALANIKNLRKQANKSSLRRGRPNTIKTGLRSPFYPKHNSDSTIYENSLYNTSIQCDKTQNQSEPHEGSVLSDVSVRNQKRSSFNSNKNVTFKKSVIEENLKNEYNRQIPKENKSITICSTPKISGFESIISSHNLSSVIKETSDDDSIPPNCKKAEIFPESQISPLYSSMDTKEIFSSDNSKNDTTVSDIKENDEKESKININESSIYFDLTEKLDTDENANRKLTKEVSLGKGNCKPSELSKMYRNSQWMNAKQFLDDCEVNLGDNVKRESIIKLRINNAGMVQASVQRFNSIVSETPTTQIPARTCRIPKSQNGTPVRVPSIFKRNEVGTRSLINKHQNTGQVQNSSNTKLIQRSISLCGDNNEFKVPTPVVLRKNSRNKQQSIKVTTPKLPNYAINKENINSGVLLNQEKFYSSGLKERTKASASPPKNDSRADDNANKTFQSNSSKTSSLKDFDSFDEWQANL